MVMIWGKFRAVVGSMVPIVLVVGLWLPAIADSTAELTPSHCSDKEQVIFSCTVKKSIKVLSVCASKQLDIPDRYVQYRYGALGVVELEFPVQRTQSLEQFKVSHYFRARVDRRELTFANKGVQYTVFSYFEGEDKPPQREAGITYRMGNGKSEGKTLQCASPYTNHLQELDEHVPCDSNSALSEMNCPQ